MRARVDRGNRTEHQQETRLQDCWRRPPQGPTGYQIQAPASDQTQKLLRATGPRTDGRPEPSAVEVPDPSARPTQELERATDPRTSRKPDPRTGEGDRPKDRRETRPKNWNTASVHMKDGHGDARISYCFLWTRCSEWPQIAVAIEVPLLFAENARQGLSCNVL